MKNKSAASTVQKWGNSLAVRLPSQIAKQMHLAQGAAIHVYIADNKLIMEPANPSKLTLDQRLERFDPSRHGGEIFQSEMIGKEKF